jgi:hypothetical protein
MKVRRVLTAGALLICAAVVANAQTEWSLDPELPVLELGPSDSWDGGGRIVNAVLKVGAVYHMYFEGNPKGGPPAIGHATSMDGVSWELDPANPVVGPGAEGAWDEILGSGATVIHDGSEFRMWYSGKQADSGFQRGGYATSSDGSTWAKHPDNPVIDVGPPGSFDSAATAPQAVIFNDGTYRMWYLATDRDVGNGGLIGYAESDDGLSWTKHPDPVIDRGRGGSESVFFNFSVVFDGSEYHMFFSHVFTFWIFDVGYAASQDGLHWTRYVRNRLVAPARFPDFAFLDTASPSVIYDAENGVFEMWFAGSTSSNARFDTTYRAVSECCSTVHTWIIPSAGYGAGARSAFFHTAVDLSNAGYTAAEYRLAWLPRGQSNLEWRWSQIDTLGPGASIRYENVLAEVFGLEPNAYGSLVVAASSEDVLAMGRISATRKDKAGGSYGQSIPAVRIDEFSVMGERRRILFGTENAEMRFNVGCQSAYEWDQPVHLELFDVEGRSLETMTITLEPWGNDQLNRIFYTHRPIIGAVDVWTDRFVTMKLYCYGSLIDNATSDPTTIPMR